MSEVLETPNLETPPADSLVNQTPMGTPEEIAAAAEATRVAALTPEQKTEEARVAALTPEERTAEETAKTKRTAAMAAPVTPEAIKLPEGFTAPEGALTPLIEIMNNAELTPAERVQGLVDLHVKALSDASEAGSKAWEDMQEQWQNEVKADPVVGGPKLDASLATVGKLVEQFGSPELREVFNTTGAGNNVHMIKFLANIGAKLTEGGPVVTAPVNAEADRARKMYPSMNA